jgi:hypothetical protein
MSEMPIKKWTDHWGDECADGSTMQHNEAHPGFQAEAAKISAKEGVSSKAAGAILASATRHASKSAKRANPRLKRVK